MQEHNGEEYTSKQFQTVLVELAKTVSSSVLEIQMSLFLELLEVQIV